MTGREVAKILVVDDHEAGRYLKAHALKGGGYALLGVTAHGSPSGPLQVDRLEAALAAGSPSLIALFQP